MHNPLTNLKISLTQIKNQLIYFLTLIKHSNRCMRNKHMKYMKPSMKKMMGTQESPRGLGHVHQPVPQLLLLLLLHVVYKSSSKRCDDMCESQLRSLEMVTPKYFISLRCNNARQLDEQWTGHCKSKALDLKHPTGVVFWKVDEQVNEAYRATLPFFGQAKEDKLGLLA